MDAPDLKRKAMRGAVWSGIDGWGKNVIMAAVFVVLARLLKREDIGVVSFAVVCFEFLDIYRDQGFGQALIQRRDLTERHLVTALCVSLAAGVALVGIVLAGAGVAESVFDQPRLAHVLRWLSIAFFLATLSTVPNAILRRQLAFRAIAVRSILSASIGGAVGITLALLGFGIWSLVAQITTISAVSTIVLWVAAGWRPTCAPTRAAFRDLASFGVHVLGIDTLYFLNERAPQLLIYPYLGPAAAGLYEVAWQLLKALSQVLTITVGAVAFPTFSRLQHDMAQMRYAFLFCTQFSSLIAFPAFFGVITVAPELVPVVFGTKWAAAIVLVQILAFRGVLGAIAAFNAPVLKATGKPSWVLGVTVLQTLGSVVAFSIAFYVSGTIVAVAMAWVIRAYVIAPAGLTAVRLAIGMTWSSYFAQCRTTFFSAAIMVIAVVLAKDVLYGTMPRPVLLGISVPIGVIVYVVSVRVLDPALFGRVLVR